MEQLGAVTTNRSEDSGKEMLLLLHLVFDIYIAEFSPSGMFHFSGEKNWFGMIVAPPTDKLYYYGNQEQEHLLLTSW